MATTLTPPAATYPRPRLVHDHATLFQEPTYSDGQPYALEDDGDDDDPEATITP